MIRYAITEAELRQKINAQRADWQTRAIAATSFFQRAGKYGERKDKNWDTQKYGVPPTPFWGQIKLVYMRLQKHKCAFCERRLSVRTRDHDVEHFRPKRAVEAWPPYPADTAFPEGYYLLAYHPLNYATACDHCNRGLKRSWFPVAAARLSSQTEPQHLAPERPLLIYPIGDIDTYPETLLGFHGIAPGSKNRGLTPHEHARAQVTIEFFELDVREELLRERSEVIESLHSALKWEKDTPEPGQRQRLQQMITRTQSAGSRHASCARCFVALFQQDPHEAERLVEIAIRYLDSAVI